MAKTIRIHELAKELGVASKEILSKCHAEGITEPKNHMAVISLGLAESIREWFSAGADVTSVETAAPVDLTKIRRPRRRKAKSEGELADGVAQEASTAQDEQEDVALTMGELAVLEAPDADLPAEPEIAAEAAPGTETEGEMEAVAMFEDSALAEPEVGSDAIAATLADTPSIDESIVEQPAEVSAEPLSAPAPTVSAPPPAPIRPAGPQLVPRPAELKGPRVVRIEAPEVLRAPRPRSPLPAEQPAVGGGVAARAGAHPRARGAPRTAEEERELAKKTAKSPRRQGRGADVVERLREWRDQDVLERKERLASATGHGLRDRRVAERRRQASTPSQGGPVSRKSSIEITAPLSLKEFCSAVGVPFNAIFAKLMEHTGRPHTVTQSIDAETAELLSMDLGVSLVVKRAKTAYERLEEEYAQREREHLEPRPPVVAMLGHVDHGKTSLLDAIRRTHVATGEAGGITQHIGAYRIDRGDWHVTFLDTPGHEAFTSMRARGANLTDVVVLVVAADDGIMPQTVEAINHARAAGVPIVVALNKIDLPGVDLNRLYAQLSEHDLTPSEWGGQTDVLHTSAVTGKGIDELVAHLSTLSELLELKADSTVPAMGTVIEAQMREGQGIAAKLLVREGTLRAGQIVVCGPGSGRIRTLLDDRGKRLTQAGPGTPVEVIGLDELPATGDKLFVVESLSSAKQIASEVRDRRRADSLQTVRKPQTLEDLLRSGGANAAIPELNVIVRADVQGSIDVLKKALGDFPAEKARLRILQAAVGTITEADVVLAQTSQAVVIGFHVVPEDRARQLAEQVGVEIRLYRVIYEMLDDMHNALRGLLAPTHRQEYRGRAEVRQVFNVTRLGTIAGCAVVDGVINRNHKVRLIRDGRVVVDGAGLGSLKRFKDDAREVRTGLECGIKIESYDDVKPGDVIETYETIEVAAEL